MTFSNRSCSGYDVQGVQGDAEFRKVLDALFCGCLEELQTSDALLRRDLFYLTELEGQTLAEAAAICGLGIDDAERMLAKTRRDVAVLLDLGLGTSPEVEPNDAAPLDDCSCRSK
jgi:hypothetical protein